MTNIKRNNILDIKNKKNQEPIVCLTAYTSPIAKILDNYCDILLVGDTLGMVIYGMKNTISVTTRMMIDHGRSVVNASRKALVVVDLPFGSYEKSPEQAFGVASKIIAKTGCDAIKLECSSAMIDTVKFLSTRGIPVMGHVGLLPQHINATGGYKYQGKNTKQAKRILEDALAVEKAGSFAVIIECVPAVLATKISQKLTIPTIGIGACNQCDGQVLVIDDVLGIDQELKPRFIKAYTNLTDQIDQAVKQYAKEVRSRQFPAKKYCFDV